MRRAVGVAMSPHADGGHTPRDRPPAGPDTGRAMPSTIQSVIITKDLPRLLRFYEGLLDATETTRFPEDGPVFFVGLQVGDSELGLVSDDGAATDAGQRMLISVAVDDVDALLDRVVEFGGGVLGPPTDMPWGQRVVHIHDPDGNAVNLTHQL
jgi:predicted enzyme related to lactoylglutathione lyase